MTQTEKALFVYGQKIWTTIKISRNSRESSKNTLTHKTPFFNEVNSSFLLQGCET